MNTLNKRFYPILLIALIIGCTFSGCKKKDNTFGSNDFSFKSYVYAYTSGIVSKVAPIRVRFTESLVSEEQIGAAVSNGVLKFSPAIVGKAVWEDDRTILFEPTDAMRSNQDFGASVNLKKLYNSLPSDLETFEFGFRTKEQFYETELEGMRTIDVNDLTNQELHGTIYTADVADAEGVEKMLAAKQSGNSDLKVSWRHEDNQTTHRFVVEKVKRSKNASKVNLNYTGKAISVKKNEEKEVEIPALGDFKVMDAKIMQDGNQAIRLVFSDPILQTQDLTGLITVNNSNYTLRFDIDQNVVNVYPSGRLTGERVVYVSAGIRNAKNLRMKSPSQWSISFAEFKPQVKLAGKGVIMPNSKGLIFPFEAVSLRAVDVEVFKIYESNVLQFLQANSLEGDNELHRVGRVVLQKQVPLSSLSPNADYSQWTRYALDLSTILNREPNAIYQVRIGFKQSYATYFCSGNGAANGEDNLALVEDELTEDGEINSFWDQSYGYYSYRDRNDPCKEAYYKSYYRQEKWAKSNVIASDLGLVAKRGEDGTYFVAVSDLVSTRPQDNVTIKFYDFQQQVIAATSTDSEGMVMTKPPRRPFVIVAEKGDQRGYLKVEDGYSLSLSRFDVAGKTTQKGLKGFIYGERGVWRPGDSLFLNFVLEDKQNSLPKGHPVTFEFYDPRGQLQQKTTKSEHTKHVYNFNTMTAADAPTGDWLAKVKVGGATFEKSLKIETVKPNRLKINVDFGRKEIEASNSRLNGKLQVNWLHGAPARNLKTEMKVQLRSVPTKFDKYSDFVFDDPARSFSSEPKTIFDGNVNDEGSANISADLSSNDAAPGKLQAAFTTRAYEKGGDFSTDNFKMPYNPYNSYVGVNLPETKWGEKRLDIGKDSRLGFVAVDPDGKPISNRKLNVGMYKLDWSWWWEESDDNITSYSSSTHYGSLMKKEIRTNTKGESNWTVNIDDWGRYLVRVCDPETGHCSGDIVYAGYPWGDDAASKSGAAMLMFSSDKTKYNVGETIELTVPMGKEGRALITIENGSKVIESYWKDAKEGENKFKFYATKEMTPNVYAHVTLIQPHAQVQNDLPIRLYGVIPIMVEDPKTRLEPLVDMPKKLEPNQEFEIKVKEKNKKGMAYTIAMVDEGLLDLTRFRTPAPWNHFYAREALGVQTWDFYDKVMGAYGGELERILSIGGGLEARPRGGQKANRFTPVVRHLGPFYLKGGRTATHKIKMPNYVGSVRTMIVAADEGAYGHAEVTTPVKKPLMVLGTLPRVLGPTERVKLPVTVFAMEKGVKNVSVSVKANSLLKVIGATTQNLQFNRTGDKLVNFDVEVASNIGVGKVTITATSGNHKATQEIELDVRNPNPYVTNVHEVVLEAGEDWTKKFDAVGMVGTNTGILEVSNIPPINLGERLEYLIQYPHGCIEQTTSSGFPQLYVYKLLKQDKELKERLDRNINATIDRLKKFQTADGGFGYWPGDSEPSKWGSTYAGHFMLEAQKGGYSVPSNLLNRWKKYQKKVARSWTASDYDYSYYGSNADLMQAYRLYTLAMADAPEWGAMNRLREKKDLANSAKWRLAAAYAIAGKPEAAQKIINKLGTAVKDYTELSYTYGSALRDEAMILEALTILKDRKKAANVVKVVSEDLSSGKWYSTQTVAYSLMAIGKYVGGGKLSNQFKFNYQIGGGQMVNAGSNNPVVQMDVEVDNMRNKSVTVKNTSKGVVYARLILRGQPTIGDSTSATQNLQIAVNYKTLDGKALNPSKIPQGTDFIAEVSVKHPGTRNHYEEMALTQIFPSGWEIHNTRMNNIQGFQNATTPEYQDIRDDRVYTYFDIKKSNIQFYRVQLNAAYQGRYYMPTVSCEAMYDNNISARQPGGWVEVVKADVPMAQ